MNALSGCMNVRVLSVSGYMRSAVLRVIVTFWKCAARCKISNASSKLRRDIAMITPGQKEKAFQLLRLHSEPPILILANAWDAASARVFEQAGFRAIATTSSGVAAALGYPDGEYISRAMLVETVAR